MKLVALQPDLPVRFLQDAAGAAAMPEREEQPINLLTHFRGDLGRGNVLAGLADGLIGKDAVVDGPFGQKPLVYADYVASGRALMQVERFVLEQVLPYYANSHTEASYCGGFITRLRREARAAIAACCGADAGHAVVFTGSGATAGLNRLCALFGVGPGTLVVIGPYEHHSNILPWRESGAEVVEIPESSLGGPDLAVLADTLARAGSGRRVVCAFSAASNVTGIVTDVAAVTRLVKAAGARMIWDYAGGGPYLPIAMVPQVGAEIDAIVVSPHKFIGGPGASGVLVVRRDAVVSSRPTWPGGGTVRFVSPTAHDYSGSLEAREEAGTPNVVGDIRAALAFLVKDAIGAGTMQRRNRELAARAIATWSSVERLELLGSLTAPRLPIFAFRMRDGKGGHIHQQLVTRMLSDRFGIQARGGCACAGPYVHRLLGIGPAQSEAMRQAVLAGDEIAKPGFTRLNFSVLLPDEKVAFILDSVARLAAEAPAHQEGYDVDGTRAIFFPRAA
jgi:selenocysteine lyase/cysteine desulfurase